MASISIADYRAVNSIAVADQSDASVGAFLGAASALVHGITGRQFGHYVESIAADGGDLLFTVYGHMMGDSGFLWISGSGNDALSGKYAYQYVDDNTLRVVGAVLPVGVTNCRIFPRFTGDFDIMESRVRLEKTPVYLVEEVRVDGDWDVRYSDSEPFGDEKILPVGEYYVPQESRSIFNSEVQFRLGCIRSPRVRVRGFVGATRKQSRRIARVTYYSGTLSVPSDLVLSIAVVGKQLSIDPTGEFQSESYDYYSYSRRSLSELKDYPISTIATLNRYAVPW